MTKDEREHLIDRALAPRVLRWRILHGKTNAFLGGFPAGSMQNPQEAILHYRRVCPIHQHTPLRAETH